ncbi:hypothetical protein M231_08079 [Tremella mesenterica]|uniref:Uncharacterized protein n=1 Tax=Tremella mesenterica TaxID=5217 RepID=A0A4Q1B9N8_TREME|nr:hypothetical protein M231_08079 [Tremella mesenterica]
MSLPPDNIHKWLIDPKYWPEVFYIPAASQKSTEPLTLQLYTSPPQQTSRRSLNFTIVPSSPISLSEDSNPSDEILFNPSTSRSVASRGWSPNNYQGPTSHFDENYSTSTRPDVWPWPTTNTGPDPITENVGTSDDLYSDFSTPNPSSTRRRSSVRRSSRDYDTDSDEKIDNARYTNWPWLRKKDDNTNPAESEEIYEGETPRRHRRYSGGKRRIMDSDSDDTPYRNFEKSELRRRASVHFPSTLELSAGRHYHPTTSTSSSSSHRYNKHCVPTGSSTPTVNESQFFSNTNQSTFTASQTELNSST